MTGIEEGAPIAGAGAAVYGAVSSAVSKANADKLDAELKNQQADELMSREAVNEQIIQRQSDMAEKTFGAQQASTGGESGVGGILAIRKATALTIANDQRDAAFKAKMLRAGANIATNLASEESTAGYVSGAGTLLTGSLKAYDLYGKASSTTTSLPKIGGTGVDTFTTDVSGIA